MPSAASRSTPSAPSSARARWSGVPARWPVTTTNGATSVSYTHLDVYKRQLTLSLNGIRDLWGYQGFEALSISKYGVNNSQVDAAFEKYTKGTGGTKCN